MSDAAEAKLLSELLNTHERIGMLDMKESVMMWIEENMDALSLEQILTLHAAMDAAYTMKKARRKS